MQTSQPVEYAQVTQAAAATIKDRSGELYGFVVISSTTGSVTAYDNTAASGTKLFEKASLAAGEVIHFGGNGIHANKGIHIVVGGTCTLNALYK